MHCVQPGVLNLMLPSGAQTVVSVAMAWTKLLQILIFLRA
jgi:hypothetical protein